MLGARLCVSYLPFVFLVVCGSFDLLGADYTTNVVRCVFVGRKSDDMV